MQDHEGYTEWDEPRKASRTEYNISMVEAIRRMADVPWKLNIELRNEILLAM